MVLPASSELAPAQWVDLGLTRTVHMRGILLLVYVSGIMFVARHFAWADGPGQAFGDRPVVVFVSAGIARPGWR